MPPEARAPSSPAGLPEGAELIASDARGLVWSQIGPQATFIRAAAPDGAMPRDLLTINRHLMDVDLGHLPPMMPLIVGSLADVTVSGNDIQIDMQLR